ncbi:MAG: sugar ABC transporter permease [Elusimicrobia bacterium CG1_02_37_114]|nr:MAG: sugar ABC transporter permease [Elusimicrobia bacterium CG1_02_37_114]PIV52262.1 MAG: sugar ABC transporter permease [Elusimicrobia bacterium CG02_land_8_20_14_3_00_37_13]PIZ12628.1 MAG: sugar ABC transporter permease [Elusimicrobia bacterium CG_4_10_14_0_8_um_filter_37_32]
MKQLTKEYIQKRKKRSELIKKSFLYLLLSILGFTFLLPFVWMLSTSLKEPGQVFVFPPQWIPNPVVFRNYVEAWNAVPFGRFFINSIIVAVCITTGQVFTSALAAYSFARLKFPGRDKLFMGYLATMMIPGQVTMIPVFIIIKKLGWIDTYYALILPGLFTAYGTFMLRQFFLTIPKDLEEAAIIDGCSRFGIFWRVVLPLAKPALATLATFVFLGSWNEFMWPLIVTNSMEMKTLPVGLASFQGLYTTDWTLLMAASMIVLAPVIVIYIFNQRFFTKGIVMTGMKG